MVELDGVPGRWFWPSPVQAAAGILSEPTEEKSVSPCHSVFQIHI